MFAAPLPEGSISELAKVEVSILVAYHVKHILHRLAIPLDGIVVGADILNQLLLRNVFPWFRQRFGSE